MLCGMKDAADDWTGVEQVSRSDEETGAHALAARDSAPAGEGVGEWDAEGGD